MISVDQTGPKQGVQPDRRNVFFIVNQHLSDGSAHALYCLRRCVSMARVKPQSKIVLIAPRTKHPLRLDLLVPEEPPNFSVVQLPALRRESGRNGVTLNLIFYVSCLLYLLINSRAGDLLVTASFHRLFKFLLKQSEIRNRLHWAYEVHQLSEIDSTSVQPDPQYEVVRLMDFVFTTTPQLQSLLEAKTRRKDVVCLGLACSFTPSLFLKSGRTLSSADFTSVISIGYVGSVYSEQGVQWLVEQWPQLCARIKNPLRLEIIGGSKAELTSLKRLSELNPSEPNSELLFHGWVSPSVLPKCLEGIDILIIPSLKVGRMPYVAITKAYDYLAFNRPVIASNLESIQFVLTPEKHALFFDAGDVVSLAAAIRTIQARGPLFVDELIRACGEKALELSWEVHARDFLRQCQSTDRQAVPDRDL